MLGFAAHLPTEPPAPTFFPSVLATSFNVNPNASRPCSVVTVRLPT
jgi:hypothetical protein